MYNLKKHYSLYLNHKHNSYILTKLDNNYDSIKFKFFLGCILLPFSCFLLLLSFLPFSFPVLLEHSYFLSTMYTLPILMFKCEPVMVSESISIFFLLLGSFILSIHLFFIAPILLFVDLKKTFPYLLSKKKFLQLKKESKRLNSLYFEYSSKFNSEQFKEIITSNNLYSTDEMAFLNELAHAYIAQEKLNDNVEVKQFLSSYFIYS